MSDVGIPALLWPDGTVTPDRVRSALHASYHRADIVAGLIVAAPED